MKCKFKVLPNTHCGTVHFCLHSSVEKNVKTIFLARKNKDKNVWSGLELDEKTKSLNTGSLIMCIITSTYTSKTTPLYYYKSESLNGNSPSERKTCGGV